MKRLLIALACVLSLLSGRAEAAIAAVSGQEVTGSVNTDNANVTFSGAWGASNHVLVAFAIYSGVVTATVAGVANAVTTLHDELLLSNTVRITIQCFQGDGSDAGFTVDMTGGTTNVRYAAKEYSGASCTEDGTSSSGNNNGGSSQSLTPDVTTAQDGSLLFGIVGSNSTADFTASGSTVSIPSDGTDIATVALGGYIITTTAGAYDLTFTSAAGENWFVAAAAVQASGGSPPASTPCVIGGGIICGGAQ